MLAALLAAAGMGFAIQQGGTCMVAAVKVSAKPWPIGQGVGQQNGTKAHANACKQKV